MNRQNIILALAGLLWCFGFGLFFYKPIGTAEIVLQKTAAPADVILPVEKPAPVTILTFGDMMLDRKVRAQINANGPEYPFANIKDFLQESDGIANDIVVANAEGPFTYNKSLTLGVKDGPLAFTFNPAVLPTLKKLGFTLLDQANNHTLNFGTAGFQQSASLIGKAGLNWFGDPRNTNVKPYVAEVRGEVIAFIGYNEFTPVGTKNILQAIKDAKEYATFVVVYAHWGEEYKLNFNSDQQKIARAFVDAGADVVIGAHPHVIEPIQIYHGKPIFYSLGNFIFDQDPTGPTGRGLSVKISLTQTSASYELFPLGILNEQAILLTGEDRQTELERLNVQTGTIVVLR